MKKVIFVVTGFLGGGVQGYIAEAKIGKKTYIVKFWERKFRGLTVGRDGLLVSSFSSKGAIERGSEIFAYCDPKANNVYVEYWTLASEIEVCIKTTISPSKYILNAKMETSSITFKLTDLVHLYATGSKLPAMFERKQAYGEYSLLATHENDEARTISYQMEVVGAEETQTIAA